MIKQILSLLLGGLFFFCNHVSVQAAGSQQVKQVRGSTKTILNSPQFRHLKGLIKPKVPRGGSKGNGNGGSSGSGSGGSGGSSGSGSSSGSSNSGGGSSGSGSSGSGSSGSGSSGGGSTGTGPGSSGNGSTGSGSGTGNGNGNKTGSGGTGNGNGSGTGNGTGGSGSGNTGGGNQNGGGSSSDNRSTATPPQSSPIQKNSTTTQSPRMSTGVAGGLGFLAQGFFWVVIAAVAGVMIYLIVRTFLDREKSIKTKKTNQPTTKTIQVEEPEKPPGEIPADVYIARAKELAAQGLYNEAVAQLLLGAMSKVERAGLIQYRRGLTNRDYLRVLRSKEGPYEAFRQIVRSYEPIGFGRRDANSSLFESSLDGYQQGFHAVSENV